jgi:hypothetical protein
MSLLTSVSKQWIMSLYHMLHTPIYMYRYFATLLLVSQCVVTMVIIELYVHMYGDKSNKGQQWQWKLMSCIFVKSKRKSRYRRRPSLGIIRSSRLKRLLVIMSAGHQMMAMSNIISKNKIETDETNLCLYDTDSFPIKIDNCCTQ